MTHHFPAYFCGQGRLYGPKERDLLACILVEAGFAPADPAQEPLVDPDWQRHTNRRMPMVWYSADPTPPAPVEILASLSGLSYTWNTYTPAGRVHHEATRADVRTASPADTATLQHLISAFPYKGFAPTLPEPLRVYHTKPGHTGPVQGLPLPVIARIQDDLRYISADGRLLCARCRTEGCTRCMGTPAPSLRDIVDTTPLTAHDRLCALRALAEVA